MPDSPCNCPPTPSNMDAMLSIDCPVHGEQARALLAQAIDEDRLIAPRPPGRCELCGTVAETRPYGPNGEEICVGCGAKDPEATERGMAKRFGR